MSKAVKGKVPFEVMGLERYLHTTTYALQPNGNVTMVLGRCTKDTGSMAGQYVSAYMTPEQVEMTVELLDNFLQTMEKRQGRAAKARKEDE